MQYNKFRVRTIIKSFRDLEVYQKTIQLSSEITNLSFLNKPEFEKEKQQLKELSEKIPQLIAESYGDKFESKELANKKLTNVLTIISDLLTKIDLLRAKFSEDKDAKELLDKFLVKYQTQRKRILNLKRSWNRVFLKNNEARKN